MKIRKTNGTLSMGQNSKFPAIALGLSLAMAASTFGSVDINTTWTVDAAWGLGYTEEARFGGSSGTSGTVNIVSGGTWNTSGQMRFAEKGVAATINVAVGGHLNAESEMVWNEDGASTQTNRLNVYGTAYVEQLKMYGRADDDIATVGNGTDAATLTILEGLLGKEGDASITIDAGSTMICTGGDYMNGTTYKVWSDSFKIDNGAGSNTGAYINLVGSGTFKVNADTATSWFEDSIQGNGVLGNWVKTTETIVGLSLNTDYNVYTAVSAPAADPEITSITSLGGGNFELTLKGANSTSYEFYRSETLTFPGTKVTGLTYSVGTGGGLDVTTDGSGDATVQMPLAGSANFVRAVGQ